MTSSQYVIYIPRLLIEYKGNDFITFSNIQNLSKLGSDYKNKFLKIKSVFYINCPYNIKEMIFILKLILSIYNLKSKPKKS